MAKYSTFPATFKRAGVTVAQVLDIQPPTETQGHLRSRAHDATSGWSTVIGSGARDLGPMTITLEFDPAAATHDALDGDINSTTLVSYAIVFPDGDTWTMNALCVSRAPGSLPAQDPTNETVDYTFEPDASIAKT